MAHYFTNEDVKSAPTTFTYTYHGRDYTFHSDAGVFSKHFIDYGTQVLLAAIDLKDAQSLLDVGCGYGTIGMLLKGDKPDLEVTMVDVNKRALALAKANVETNNVGDCDIHESSCYDQVTGCYDLIVSNPPIRAGKKIVSTILSESIHHLNNNGRLVIVIQKKQGAPSAKALMEKTFGNVTILKRDKGYYILQSEKRD